MKNPKTLSEKLKGYSMLGAGIIASSAADAQIVYTDVNPDSTNVGVSTYAFDLNHDGITDFTLEINSYSVRSIIKRSIKILPAQSNSVAFSGYLGYAQVANYGDKIDSSLAWRQTVDLGWYSSERHSTYESHSTYGYWHGQTMKFLPLRFKINGKLHYGWIRLSVSGNYRSFIVQDYAYQAKPDTPVIAGCVNGITMYADEDSDGYGDLSKSIFIADCIPLNQSGYVADSADCNDLNSAINPGVPEVCNNIDDNCNGQIDEGVQIISFADEDGDGYGDPESPTPACTMPGGSVIDSTDCNDHNADIHPASPVIKWQESFRGNFYPHQSIKKTDDNGYIVGWHSSIIKLDSLGRIQWQKSVSGNVNDVQQTTDDGFIAAEDYWITKLDAAGNIEWQKGLGSGDVPTSIDEFTGGYITAGHSTTINNGIPDYWVAKLDVYGTIKWQKSIGGSLTDYATSIQQTFDGGSIVTGYSFSNDDDVSGHHGSTQQPDYWIVKLDASGNIQWQKSLGGSNSDLALSIEQTTDAGFIVAGYSNSINGDVTGHHGANNGIYDYWIVNLDTSGNIQWQKSFGGSQNDYATAIRQTTDGGFIVAGYSRSNDGDVSGNHGLDDYWIVKLDTLGNIQWQQCYGNSQEEYGYSIEQTNSYDFIVGGYSFAYNGYWILKLAGHPGGVELCNGLDDNCNGQVDEGLAKNYYADWDGDGYGDKSKEIDSCAQPLGYAADSTDCDDTNPNVNPGEKEIPNNGIDDNCNGIVDEYGTGINPVTNPAPALSVFPNPTNGNFIIELKLSNQVTGHATIEVINVFGQSILTENGKIENGKLETEIYLSSAIAGGMYLVKVIVNDKVYTTQIGLQK